MDLTTECLHLIRVMSIVSVPRDRLRMETAKGPARWSMSRP
jgi:hypothetical protein